MVEIIKCSEELTDREKFKLTDSFGAERTSDHEGEVFSIVKYIIYKTVNKDGEPVTMLRFVTDTGTVIGTSSSLMIERFEKMLDMLGMPLEDVAIVSGVSKQYGNKYYTLALV